jgi:hypothetical protein
MGIVIATGVSFADKRRAGDKIQILWCSILRILVNSNVSLWSHAPKRCQSQGSLITCVSLPADFTSLNTNLDYATMLCVTSVASRSHMDIR